MASFEKSNEVLDEVRVKNEPICDKQSISQIKKAMKVKEEPIDMPEEVEIKAEEKFSATEEFANKILIAFFNEEPTQGSTSTDDNSIINTNIKRNKSKKVKK